MFQYPVKCQCKYGYNQIIKAHNIFNALKLGRTMTTSCPLTTFSTLTYIALIRCTGINDALQNSQNVYLNFP